MSENAENTPVNTSGSIASLFVSGQNFAFRVMSADAEFLIKAFEQYQVSSIESKRVAFLEFVTRALQQKEENAQLQLELKTLQNQVAGLKEALEGERNSGTVHQESLEARVLELTDQMEELAAENESLKESRSAASVVHQVAEPTEPNQLLVTLPHFQHRLLATVCGSLAVKQFYTKVDPKSGLILSIPDFENKKELMSLMLINIFVGTLLNYHYNPVYMPHLGKMVAKADIVAAIDYAKQKLAEQNS